MAEPTQADIGYPVVIDLVGSDGGPREPNTVVWCVIHDGEGSAASIINTLSNNPQASAHAVIAADGTLTYMVPIDRVAWHPGNDQVARGSIGIEQEGFADPAKWTYTDAQYASAAAFIRWANAQGCSIPAVYIGKDDQDSGPIPDHPGILGHMDVPDGQGGWGGVSHHTDPGPAYDFAKLVNEVASGQVRGTGNGGGGTGPGGGTPDGGTGTVASHGGTIDVGNLTGDARGVIVTLPGGAPGHGQYGVGHGFLDRWILGANAGTDHQAIFDAAIDRDGWPLSGEFGFTRNGVTYTIQIFERAIYSWDGTNVDAFDVGREFLHANRAALPRDVWG